MRLAPILLLGMLISGCGPKNLGPAPPGVSTFHASMTHEILRWEASYELTLRTVGRAQAQGLIPDESVAAIESAANVAYRALEKAKQTLAVYINAGGGREPVVSALAALTDAMTGFLIEYRKSSRGVGELQ